MSEENNLQKLDFMLSCRCAWVRNKQEAERGSTKAACLMQPDLSDRVQTGNGKAYHRCSSPGNGTSLCMNFLPASSNLWASRSKWPNPHHLLRHQCSPIALGGARATGGDGHMVQTLWA